MLGGSRPRRLPFFAPSDALEDVTPATWQDCDFVWVELPECCPDDPAVWAQCMPYNGAHLYPVETAEYLVSAGVVRAQSIAKGLRASRHLDPADLKQAWDVVIEVLAQTDPERRGKFERPCVSSTSA